MNVTLNDGPTAYANIHGVETPGVAYASDGGTRSSFNSLDIRMGYWPRFLADMPGDGGNSTLVPWGLDIEAVPEPVTWALLLFGGVMGSVKLAQHLRRRKAA
jgi:hypothetical protein